MGCLRTAELSLQSAVAASDRQHPNAAGDLLENMLEVVR
jgi:hypothetical protein